MTSKQDGVGTQESDWSEIGLHVYEYLTGDTLVILIRLENYK
jgi:hypothetical protein